MQKNKTQILQMKFAPNTIEHLGVKMYSTLPPVVSELIANSYDADASEVTILLKDSTEKEIVISDNGHGMSFDEINESFLTIGRNRRVKNETDESPKGRKVIGKKGLGKLSFFGIAHEIEIITVKENKKNSFVMDWNAIMEMENEEGGIENYEPEILILDEETQDSNGTVVTLRKIQRTSIFDAGALADSISKYFILPNDFTIKISHNDEDCIEIDNKRRYSTLTKEVEWSVPAEVEFSEDCEFSENITGHLLTTETPIKPSTNMRGITLFSRKKLVNLPEYFSDSTSSHFFNYLTGWLEVDFIDDLDEDVIGTNRQSLNWDHPEMQKLRSCLQGMLKSIEKDWREKRREKREEGLKEKTGIDIPDWFAKLPDDVRTNMEPVIKNIIQNSETPEEANKRIKELKKVAPEYIYYHYQNLHKTLSTAVFEAYKDKNFYNAVAQGVIRYIRAIQSKSSSKLTDICLIKFVFSPDQKPSPAPRISPELSVVKKFNRPNGTEFEELTKRNITSGHGLLAKAMWSAFRSPVAHELATDLRDSGLYTEQDCLDALGLLSHLFRRLDNSELS